MQNSLKCITGKNGMKKQRKKKRTKDKTIKKKLRGQIFTGK
jgi:hypothetical protein